MTRLFYYLLLCIAPHAYATDLGFKSSQPERPVLSIVFSILLLGGLLVYIGIKKKKELHVSSGLKLVDKKKLGTKCAIYVVEFQGVKFFLADNQHHLLLLKTTECPPCE